MERMGGDAQLSQASTQELAVVLSTTDIAPELQSVVLAKDSERLGVLLGKAPECVLLAPPGPPGSKPGPMQPAVPPPPPEEEDEGEDPTACSEHDVIAGRPAHLRELLSV
jgi:hypothetical protein